MSTNDTEVEETQVTETPEDDEKLRQDLKDALANDSKPAAKEPAPEAPNAEETEEAKEEPKPEATLTTEPEHDLDWYKKAYEESTKEGLRLKGELDKKVETPPPPTVITPPATDEVLTPEQLYIRQKQNEEITAAFSEITAKYPALKEPGTYDSFVAQANLVGRVIVEGEKRYPSPTELYEKTAVILGLTPDNSEAIGTALKDSAGAPRTASSIPGPAPKSKVTEEMIAMNLKMYPDKSRQQIIEELEPHIT